MQVRVVSEVLANRLADARELALDDAFLCFPARREQHLAVAFTKPCLTVRHRVGCDSQRIG